MFLKNKNFKLNNGILDYDIKDPVTSKVKEFYQEDPFPNYKIDDNKHTILQAGNNNWVMKELKELVEDNKFELIETMGKEIALICLKNEKVFEVKVKINKPEALKISDNVGIIINRRKNEN